ncbi:hypothetical protein D3C81_2282770 [compost metagenome]
MRQRAVIPLFHPLPFHFAVIVCRSSPDIEAQRFADHFNPVPRNGGKASLIEIKHMAEIEPIDREQIILFRNP